VTSPNSEQLERIAQMVAAGEVRVELEDVLPITDAGGAQQLSEAGHVRGKIVLTTFQD
jgi:NADPH:quinone reductase-like Zn-dependent oxidoreductase